MTENTHSYPLVLSLPVDLAYLMQSQLHKSSRFNVAVWCCVHANVFTGLLH